MTDAEDLECPVCLKLMLPPTSLCDRGHVVCSLCRPALQQCPTCRGKFLQMKNTFLDQVLSKHMFECDGCKHQFTPDQLRLHTNACFYMFKSKCPFYKCEQQIIVSRIDEHLRRDHPDSGVSTAVTGFNSQTGKTVTQLKFKAPLNSFTLSYQKPQFALPRSDEGYKYTLQHRFSDNKYQLIVRLLENKCANSFEVCISCKYDRNEFKCYSKPYDYKTEEAIMWSAPNFILDKDQCRLFLGGQPLNISCILHSV